MTAASADLSWGSVTDAVSYNWKVVAEGAGSAAPAAASGSGSSTSATAIGLSSFTGYDLYVESNCGGGSLSGFEGPVSFFTLSTNTGNLQVGTGTSSSSSRGPIQRSDVNSSTVYTRWHHVYTEADLAAAGLECGASLTGLNWEKGNSNIIDQPGDATWKVYIKNSTSTTATVDSWDNLVAGSEQVVDRVFNIANNFPSSSGWMPFNFDAPYVYDGGALEISVDWDGSAIATPGVSTGFNGNGAVTWRWESTAPEFLVAKRTASSSSPSTISDLKDERANIQFTFNLDDAIDGDVSCASCPGDINGDGLVDINDFLSLNSAFGSNCTCAEDINGDGTVDVNDFLELNSAFGNVCQ